LLDQFARPHVRRGTARDAEFGRRDPRPFLRVVQDEGRVVKRHVEVRQTDVVYGGTRKALHEMTQVITQIPDGPADERYMGMGGKGIVLQHPLQVVKGVSGGPPAPGRSPDLDIRPPGRHDEERIRRHDTPPAEPGHLQTTVEKAEMLVPRENAQHILDPRRRDLADDQSVGRHGRDFQYRMQDALSNIQYPISNVQAACPADFVTFSVEAAKEP